MNNLRVCNRLDGSIPRSSSRQTDWRKLWRAMEVSVVALEQSGIVPAAGNGEGATSSIVSTGASRSYCLSLFSLVTELPNPKFTRYMALAKRAVGLQFSQQVHIFLK
jgi:hypothetical protein